MPPPSANHTKNRPYINRFSCVCCRTRCYTYACTLPIHNIIIIIIMVVAANYYNINCIRTRRDIAGVIIITIYANGGQVFRDWVYCARLGPSIPHPAAPTPPTKCDTIHNIRRIERKNLQSGFWWREIYTVTNERTGKVNSITYIVAGVQRDVQSRYLLGILLTGKSWV